jgi:nucleotide-binding universal stress UspA family protein
MKSLEIDQKTDVVLVVGYDGTEPAQRALRSAAEMLRDRPGRMEVVYVARVPTTMAFSPIAIPEMSESLDSEARDLAKEVEDSLASTEVKWHFQRRDGEIAPELLATGREQLDSGPSTRVVLVLGGSAHKIDRYLNSTPAKVIRQDRFEVVVVP